MITLELTAEQATRVKRELAERSKVLSAKFADGGKHQEHYLKQWEAVEATIQSIDKGLE